MTQMNICVNQKDTHRENRPTASSQRELGEKWSKRFGLRDRKQIIWNGLTNSYSRAQRTTFSIQFLPQFSLPWSCRSILSVYECLSDSHICSFVSYLRFHIWILWYYLVYMFPCVPHFILYDQLSDHACWLKWPIVVTLHIPVSF